MTAIDKQRWRPGYRPAGVLRSDLFSDSLEAYYEPQPSYYGQRFRLHFAWPLAPAKPHSRNGCDVQLERVVHRVTYQAPKVRCEDRSGYPCSRVVALDSRDCGDRAHFPGANGGVPITRRRARAVPLTVDEDYDLIDDPPDLDPVTFNSYRIHITQAALAAWGRHPKILQARIREALLRGGYWRTVTGEHLLEIGRHQMLLSSDGRRCESYVHLPPPPVWESSGPIDALLEPGWDREAVTLSPHAVRQFAGRHRVSEDEGADELFDLLDDAAVRGKQMRFENGNHSLAVDGFTLTLTPDGTTVVSYRTVHAERMPSEVRNKVKSRFNVRKRSKQLSQEDLMALLAERDRAVSQVPLDRWVPTVQIRELFDPGRARITAAVIDRSRTDRNAAVDAVREELRQASRNGRWVDGDEGLHLLEYRCRRWSISPNGRGVLSCDPPWPESGNDDSTLQVETP